MFNTSQLYGAFIFSFQYMRRGTSMADKNIVIIGAGYAGVHAAKKLAKKYKKMIPSISH
jgi:hypothetical protein